MDSVPAGGGQVVLSRLAWPGYTATNATVREEATDGYLLTIDVPETAAGSVVDIVFRPPGWTVGLGSMALAVAGAATWAVLDVVGRRRRGRRSAAAPAQETVEL